MSKILEWLAVAKTWVASLLADVKLDGWLHLLAGLLITAFSVIVLNMGWYSIVPCVVIAVLNEGADCARYGLFSWRDIIYTMIGGIMIYLMSTICILMQ